MKAPQLFREHFSRELRQARRSRYISRAALAKRMGVSKPTIVAWENAWTSPRTEEVFGRVCTYLGINGQRLMQMID